MTLEDEARRRIERRREAAERVRLREDAEHQERARAQGEQQAAFRGFGLELAEMLRKRGVQPRLLPIWMPRRAWYLRHWSGPQPEIGPRARPRPLTPARPGVALTPEGNWLMVFPYVAIRDEPSDSHEQAVQYAVQILEGEIPLRFAPWRLLGLLIACSSVLGCFALLLLR